VPFYSFLTYKNKKRYLNKSLEKAYIIYLTQRTMVKVKSYFISGRVFSNSSEAFTLLEKERFGEKTDEKVIYSPFEAVFLAEKKKIQLFDSKNKEIKLQEIINKFGKKDKDFMKKYLVFKDLRKKGHIVKSALKFGVEFRVYEKGSKLGEEHARWILFPFSEHEKISIKEFCAKNRVANSTNKKLMVAVVDDEEDVSYYETSWMKI
jgi:tRNA-intron endonuclease, archaea type